VRSSRIDGHTDPKKKLYVSPLSRLVGGVFVLFFAVIVAYLLARQSCCPIQLQFQSKEGSTTTMSAPISVKAGLRYGS